MTNFVKELNESNFEETINSNKIVLVDIYTTWCGPCKMMMPILEQLGEHYTDNIIISKLDAESNMNVSTQLNVRNVPTLILFKDGKEVERQTGAKNKTELINWISKHEQTIEQ
jgi:thioredoxin 1